MNKDAIAAVLQDFLGGALAEPGESTMSDLGGICHVCGTPAYTRDDGTVMGHFRFGAWCPGSNMQAEVFRVEIAFNVRVRVIGEGVIEVERLPLEYRPTPPSAAERDKG